jgi:hypothetical protein
VSAAWDRTAVVAYLHDRGAMVDDQHTDTVVYYRGLTEEALRAVDAAWPTTVEWQPWNNCPGLAAILMTVAPVIAAHGGSIVYHGYLVFGRPDARLTVEGFHYEGSPAAAHVLKDRFRTADERTLSADDTRLYTWWD